MGATIYFSRGFAIPKAQFDGINNPLAIANLFGGGGRFNQGDEEGVSFSIQVANSEAEAHTAYEDAKQGAEYYAKTRMVNKEGYVPVSVTFNLTEQTFPVLQGKLGIPKNLNLGEKMTLVEPIQTFDELKSHSDGEIIVQGATLTPGQLRQLKIEIGKANMGIEGQSISLVETISSKAEFTYKPFEGNKSPLGENGELLK